MSGKDEYPPGHFVCRSGALVPMTVGIKVAWLVTGMIVVFAGHILLSSLVPMTVRIEVSGRVAGMIVVLSRHLLLAGCVAMAVRIEIARLVARMIVVLSWLFLGHSFLLALALGNSRDRLLPSA